MKEKEGRVIEIPKGTFPEGYTPNYYDCDAIYEATVRSDGLTTLEEGIRKSKEIEARDKQRGSH